MTESTSPSPSQTIQRLVLVFDADAGALSALVDSTRKLLRINGCSLCATTHGLFGEKSEWAQCKDELGVPVESLHRDELFGAMRQVVAGQLPCVVAETADGAQHLLLQPEVLERSRGSVNDFRARLLHHAEIRDLHIPASVHA